VCVPGNFCWVSLRGTPLQTGSHETNLKITHDTIMTALMSYMRFDVKVSLVAFAFNQRALWNSLSDSRTKLAQELTLHSHVTRLEVTWSLLCKSEFFSFATKSAMFPQNWSCEGNAMHEWWTHEPLHDQRSHLTPLAEWHLDRTCVCSFPCHTMT